MKPNVVKQLIITGGIALSVAGGLVVVLLPAAFEPDWAHMWVLYLVPLGAVWGLSLDAWKGLWAPIAAGLVLGAVQVAIWIAAGSWTEEVAQFGLPWTVGQFAAPVCMAVITMALRSMMPRAPRDGPEPGRGVHHPAASSGPRSLALVGLAVGIPLATLALSWLLGIVFTILFGLGAIVVLVALAVLSCVGPLYWGTRLRSARELWAPAVAAGLFGGLTFMVLHNPFDILGLLATEAPGLAFRAGSFAAGSTALAAFSMETRRRPFPPRQARLPGARVHR